MAAPLGPQGPRFVPGQGRERILAALGAETVGTRRDLAAERTHLDAVLDALPFLADTGNEEDAAWLLDDPEEALAAVESLPQLPALAAVDWPKGKPVKVIQVNARNLAVKIQSDRDWFHLDGQATLDDGLVLGFTALLEAAQGRSRYIQMGEGVYAALTRSLKEQLAELASVAEPTGKGSKGTKGGSRLPHLAAGWLADTLDGLEVDSDTDFCAAVDRLQTAQQSQPALPGTLQAELRPYQEDGYVWAMRLAQAGFGGCLADDMGLGKTLQALAVLLARAPDGAALVVAPTSVCGNWLAEIQRFAPSLNAHIYAEAERAELLAGAGPLDVVIVSYTLLQQAGDDFAARPWHTLVADEAQAVKNAAAKRSRALFELDAGFRLALSGTPVENRLGELWSIMRFANPGLLGTEGRFNERFAGPIERSRDREAQHRLRRLIAPFILRRTKAQVLRELPERTEQILHIVPGPAEAAHYEALRRQAVAQVESSLESANAGVARFNILAQLTRLRRAACDPRLISSEPPIPGAKVQAFAELAVELAANGHKALVFSQFVDFLHLLRDALDAAGLAYQYLDGATPAAERTRRVAAFQAGEGELFLISLKAGGFGLNLTAADYVIITDPWWNPAAEDQAMGRAHRMGQLRPVTVYRLVLKGSIEERILDLHDDKRALAEGVLSGEDTAALPSTEDLLALMRGD
ncbi:MAG: DEAD/DEAH box helicase [Pseudomonadota bacterium]